jgi:hypothetical protein
MNEATDIREARYWPFKVLPLEEQSDQHKEEIRFLEDAYQLGYRPYMFWAGNYSASVENGRLGDIIVRGRSRWEVMLGGQSNEGGSAFVDEFSSAAKAVLRWLQGDDVVAIFKDAQSHLVLMGFARRTGRLYRLWSDDPTETRGEQSSLDNLLWRLKRQWHRWFPE